MKIDVALPPVALNKVPAIAKAAEALGFDGIWISETTHDPFLPAALIAEHTQEIRFGTAIAVAFGRSPATLAYTSWDLAQASNGRFILGLGTQVKPHIEKRFGMPWPESVVGKLDEQISAVRAFWRTWQTGSQMDFRGQYYRLSLMTPFFNPGPILDPEIPIYIAGVNPGLARLAGRTADGFLVHPFHTIEYLNEIMLPAIKTGLVRSGRERDQIEISATVFIVTSKEEDYLVRSQIGFYASTPSYRSVMAMHGWEQQAEELSHLVRRGRWGELPSVVGDEILEKVALVCSPEMVGVRLMERYSGVADRLGLYVPFVPGERDGFWRKLVRAVK